ncbi:MAG TPA: hypothetical protein PK728_11235 [Bacillota bacterium]|nr:hypothetical protein [Bacillota bacterium]
MIEIFKKRLDILILMPVAAMLAAAVISLVVMPAYRSSAIVMVDAAGTDGAANDYNSLLVNRQLVRTFCILAVLQDSLTEIAGQLKGVSTSELSKKISVSQVKDLELLKISVKDDNPERAAFIANKTVEVLRRKTRQLYGGDTIKVISYAESQAEEEKPGIIINTVAAGAGGLIFAAAISIWLGRQAE